VFYLEGRAAILGGAVH